MLTKQTALPFDKKGVIKKTIQVGTSTLLSRLLGLAREILLVQFLGAGALSDAFFTAYKIPNSLRKIFAEGALSSALVPSLVALIKKNRRDLVGGLMSVTFLLFEGILLVLCALIFWQADLIIRFLAPGWYMHEGVEPLVSSIPFFGSLLRWFFPAWYIPCPNPAIAQHAITYLRLLISFIMYLSSSAILAGALQAVNHFFVPAIAPVLMNVAYIAGLVCCLKLGLSVEALCYFILAGGVLQFFLHMVAFYALQFRFSYPTSEIKPYFRELLVKFIPFFFSMSILEVNLSIITTVATYLPAGSISFLNYANRFMGIPLGVFATAFSTILLPYFSRVSTYAPKRLSMYLLEAAKVVFWITVPATFIMMVLAEKIFLTLFLSSKFTVDHVAQASNVLIAFLSGLFFFSLYKIILNLFYALKGSTSSIIIVSLAAIVSNYCFGKLLMPWCGAVGLALAMVLSCVLQSVLLLWFLHRNFSMAVYIKPFLSFVVTSGKQLVCLMLVFLLIYKAGIALIAGAAPQGLKIFLLNKMGFWLWVGPLCGGIAFMLYKTRQFFSVHLYFLE